MCLSASCVRFYEKYAQLAEMQMNEQISKEFSEFLAHKRQMDDPNAAILNGIGSNVS